jgi:hypothetical protein
LTDIEKGDKKPQRRFSITKRKSFSPEFKREAVRLLETSQKPPTDLARELGVRQLFHGYSVFVRNRLQQSLKIALGRGLNVFLRRARGHGLDKCFVAEKSLIGDLIIFLSVIREIKTLAVLFKPLEISQPVSVVAKDLLAMTAPNNNVI